MASVNANPQVVDNYLAEELAAGKLLSLHLGVKPHTSPIGLIPKAHQPGRFHLIVDLSVPEGLGVSTTALTVTSARSGTLQLSM